ncbi:DUF574-domain-containing protein [Trematosphaeria pertusa]|uniref:DUF574-domain-containing protein n=1 Tax=Trematosphaeria pertusa TaxID=390896 RepID=A0A6A6IB68_9PLEO|nr:DUF574-domain-containing protein [Trematosphaeria pertusa]KAF2247656.1 DUF574-domain-containing protein [Trematosphaeria pertusa]
MSAVKVHPNGLDEYHDRSKAAPARPVVARMYDWYLNGTHSYAVDRQAGEEVERAIPDIKPLVQENRAFLRRAVRWLAKNGVTQFIDVGSGLPTAGNTHETVLKVSPKAMILYVDIEETVVEEGNEFIEKTGWSEQVGMIQGNALDPTSIVNHPETKRIIDFSKPVALMHVALIHFFHEPQYVPVLDFWKKKLVKESAFVMTHCTSDDRDREAHKKVEDVYNRTPTPVLFRPRKEIVLIMDGWEVVEPGVVRPKDWKMEEMEEGEQDPPVTAMWWVAVGKLV